MNIDTPEGLAQAVAWQQSHISKIKEGGYWCVPGLGAMIRIWHSTKTAELVMSVLPMPHHFHTVFNAMGWTWKGEDVRMN